MELFEKQEYRLIIVGSRDFNNELYLKAKLDKVLSGLLKTYNVVIISGGARGVDTLANTYAKENGLELKEFLPNYEKYGKPATHIRNSEMINYASEHKDLDGNILGGILVFWDGISKGSYSMIQKASKAGLPGEIYNYNNDLERGLISS